MEDLCWGGEAPHGDDGDDDLIQSCDNDGDDDDNDYYDVDVVGSGAILQDHITAI